MLNEQEVSKKRNISQLKAGAILSYLQMALGIIIGIAYTPVMIRLLGQSEYGLYNLVSSTVSMLSMLSLGFGAGYIRYYAKYKKNADYESIYKLNGLFLIIFSVIGIAALLCGLFLIFNIRMIFSTGLTEAEYKTATILMILMVANLSISFPFSIFRNIISAHEKFIFLKTLGMVTTVLGPLVNLPLLLLGYGSIGLVVFSVSLNLLVDVIYIFVVKCKLKQKFIFHGFEKGIFKGLFLYTAFIALNIVVDQINWSIDKFLLGRFKGTISVAIYSVGYSLYSYYMSFSTSISGVFSPRIHRIANETSDDLLKQREEFTDLFVKVGRIQYLILALIASGVVFFGQPFIYYWAGDGYFDSYYVTLLLILPSTIALTQNIGIEIQRAKNLHQFRSIVYFSMAIINLIISIFLCQIYGAIGSAIGTAISLILCNGIIMNIFYHKKCNINIFSYWKNILRQSLGLVLPSVYGLIIMLFINISSLWLLLALILSYVVVYATSMYFLGMNDYERNLVLTPFRKIFRSKNAKNS